MRKQQSRQREHPLKAPTQKLRDAFARVDEKLTEIANKLDGLIREYGWNRAPGQAKGLERIQAQLDHIASNLKPYED